MNARIAPSQRRVRGTTSGGRLLIDALLANGADRAFFVPGEKYLAVLDALRAVQDRLALVVCRESGTTNLAKADGKLTGRPGIAFVTRGPGATNAIIGVDSARQDATPPGDASGCAIGSGHKCARRAADARRPAHADRRSFVRACGKPRCRTREA